eukprot:7471761-Prorocentrum_lima.AAC.1
MTSSLVGSEMCIRDRSVGDSLLVANLLKRPAKSHAKCSDPVCPASSRSCLLYTSDAADDM